MTKFITDRPVARSTQWARDNKEIVRERSEARRRTLYGKLVSLLAQTRYRAKHVKGFDNDLTLKFLQDLHAKQNNRCALSGLEMTVHGVKNSNEYWHSLSLDRIDSSRGYTMDNVQFVCTGINRMKQDMPNEMFIEFCRKVSGYHG